MMNVTFEEGLNQQPSSSQPEPVAKTAAAAAAAAAVSPAGAGQGRPPPSPPPWNPSDWIYAAEGGKHAIFRYSGRARAGGGGGGGGGNDFFSGLVLRIAKRDLANASSSHPKKKSVESSSSQRTCKIIEFMEESAYPSQTFQRKIVQPLLGHCYLDLARVICLPASCCAQIYYGTLVSGSIPPSRLPSWKHTSTGADTKDKENASIIRHKIVRATLLRDHTRLSNHPRIIPTPPAIFGRRKTTRRSPVLSVEIKPKAGYVTASPLVFPYHRCKYYRTRYSMQQELMEKGYVQKGWLRTKEEEEEEEGGQQQRRANDHSQGTAAEEEDVKMHHQAFVPGEYSPLDIFSGDIVRIHKALRDLSQNMQNNFRVWCDGIQIFGEPFEALASEGDCREILDGIFHQPCSSAAAAAASSGDSPTREPPPDNQKSTLLDVITGTVSKVLHRESLLSNLLSMQQLDVIDGDGAVLVYKRLVALCNGSNVEAERLLDEAALIPRDGLVSGRRDSSDATAGSSGDGHYVGRSSWDSSPYTMPECDKLGLLLDEIVKFQAHLRNRIQEGSDPDEMSMNISHIKSIQYVNGLTKEACVYLLRNWLLSLSLCDVSFFVTFRFLTDGEYRPEAAAASASSSYDDDEEFQSCEHGGIALCSMQDYGGVWTSPSSNSNLNSCPTSIRDDIIAVHYEVKIVDCDPKPASKLRDREEVESKFQFISVNHQPQLLSFHH